MQEKYGDDVQFPFVESQGTSADDTEKFVLQKKWLNDHAIWTNEAPFETGARDERRGTVHGQMRPNSDWSDCSMDTVCNGPTMWDYSCICP